MSVTIDNAVMKWANKAQGFYGALNTSDSWLWRMSAIYGKQGKVSIANIDTSQSLLTDMSCNLDNLKELDGDAIEFEIKDYEVKIPIRGCEIRGTWLETELKKGTRTDETEYFIDDLLPIVASRARYDLQSKMIAQILANAKADGNVGKVAPVTATDKDTAHAGIITFIKSLPLEISEKHASDDVWEKYSIFVSPAYKTFLDEFYENTDGNSNYIMGYEIVATSSLMGNQMFCSTFSNLIYAPDLSPSGDYFKIIEKREINTSYIKAGVSIGASFIDADKIVITNNI